MKRPFVIFYALITYAVAELIWWGYMLVKLQPGRIGMIMGEGLVFVVVLSFGAYNLHKSVNRERKLQEQKKNGAREYRYGDSRLHESPVNGAKVAALRVQQHDR